MLLDFLTPLFKDLSKAEEGWGWRGSTILNIGFKASFTAPVDRKLCSWYGPKPSTTWKLWNMTLCSGQTWRRSWTDSIWTTCCPRLLTTEYLTRGKKIRESEDVRPFPPETPAQSSASASGPTPLEFTDEFLPDSPDLASSPPPPVSTVLVRSVPKV